MRIHEIAEQLRHGRNPAKDLRHAPVPVPAPLMTIRSTNKHKEIDMTAKFETYQDATGKFRFRLKASNGEIVAQGEAYETKQGALDGTDAVRRAAAAATVVDLG